MSRRPQTYERFQPRLASEPPERFAYGEAAGAGARQAAGALNRLSQVLGQAADRADVQRGDQDGARAGFDPEFRRQEGNSAYARAYNARASQVYLTRTETEVRRQLDEAYLAHRDDPSALSQAFGSLREQYGAAQAFREDDTLRAGFETLFDRAALGYTREAARSQIARDEDAARAAAADFVSLRLNAVERLAAQAGLDDTADALIGGELGALRESLVAYGPAGAFSFAGEDYEADPSRAGAYSVTQMQSVLVSAETRIETARVTGAFERAATPGARRAFRDQFLSDAQEGRFARLDAGEVARIDGGMRRAIAQDETEANARRRDAERAIEGALREAETVSGAGLTPRTSFETIIAAADQIGGDEGAALRQRAAQAAALADFSADFATEPPAAMAEFVRAERARLQGGGASAFEAQRLQTAERIQAEASTTLARDPLAWAARTGLARIPPLEMAGSGEGDQAVSAADAFAASLSRRAGLAEAVADHFGAPVKYFTREEREALSNAVDRGQIDMAQAAGAIVQALGPNAAGALEEMHGGSGRLAHAGGLMLAGASRAARDMALGDQLHRQEGFQSRRAPGAFLQNVQGGIMGDFAREQPEAAQTIAHAANLIYEARALREGWESADMAAGSGQAYRGYQDAVHEAAGAVMEGGQRYGGFVEHRRATLIAPTWLDHRRFGQAVDMIARGRVEGPRVFMRDGSGGDVPASMLSRAQLRSIGSDRYLVTFGGESFALNDRGEPYVLDMGLYRDRLAAARPDWVRQ